MPRINHIPDPNARKIIEQSDKTFGNRYKIEFLKPARLDKEVLLRAKVIKKGRKSRTIACSVYSDGEECIRGEVTMVMIAADEAVK